MPICNIPWTWLEIDLAQNRIRNCCKTNWINDNNLLLFDHPIIIERRSNFLKNIRVSDCNHCWRLEDSGQISYRQYTKQNQYLQTNSFPLLGNVPKTLTINFGNLCNLSCSYCSEEYSSKWAIEKSIPVVIEKNLNLKKSVFDYIKKILLDNNLYHLILIGGEPTINPQFYQLLDYIQENIYKRSTQLKITVQTNGMYSSKDRGSLITICRSKNIKITYRFSIESIGSSAEFSRTGLNWEKFNSNFRFMYENTNFNTNLGIAIHPTLNLYCIESFSKFLSWMEDFDLDRLEDFGFNHVEYPIGISLRTLGKYSRLLWNNSSYNNRKLQIYAQRVKNFLDSFNNVPKTEDLEIIQTEYIKTSMRSGIKIEDAIPNLDNLVRGLLDK